MPETVEVSDGECGPAWAFAVSRLKGPHGQKITDGGYLPAAAEEPIPAVQELPHSCRSATIGSTLAACRAGRYEATTAQTTMIIDTAT